MSPTKGTSMKLATALVALLTAASVHAQPIETWNVRNEILGANGTRGFARTTSTTTPTSITIPTTPTGTKTVKFDPPAQDFWFCADTTSNSWCSGGKPTTTSDTVPWEKNPTQRRLGAISGTTVTTIWLQADTSSSLVTGHWFVE